MTGLQKRFEQIGLGNHRDRKIDLVDKATTIFSQIPISNITRDPDQPRKDVGDLQDIKASIQAHGILQPCIVTIVGEDLYQLIAGERRFTAAKELGFLSVPCLVRTVEEHSRYEIQLIENLHRKDLTPVEEATSYQKLMDDHSLTQRQLAERLGKSLTTINQTVRVLSLSAEMLEEAGRNDRISKSILLEIARYETQEERTKMFEAAKAGHLTVKTARPQKISKIAPKMNSKYVIRTETAVLTLTFEGKITPDQSQIINVLSAALEIEQAKVA